MMNVSYPGSRRDRSVLTAVPTKGLQSNDQSIIKFISSVFGQMLDPISVLNRLQIQKREDELKSKNQHQILENHCSFKDFYFCLNTNIEKEGISF